LNNEKIEFFVVFVNETTTQLKNEIAVESENFLKIQRTTIEERLQAMKNEYDTIVSKMVSTI
jgi:hypothetical protein